MDATHAVSPSPVTRMGASSKSAPPYKHKGHEHLSRLNQSYPSSPTLSRTLISDYNHIERAAQAMEGHLLRRLHSTLRTATNILEIMVLRAKDK